MEEKAMFGLLLVGNRWNSGCFVGGNRAEMAVSRPLEAFLGVPEARFARPRLQRVRAHPEDGEAAAAGGLHEGALPRFGPFLSV